MNKYQKPEIEVVSIEVEENVTVSLGVGGRPSHRTSSTSEDEGF